MRRAGLPAAALAVVVSLLGCSNEPSGGSAGASSSEPASMADVHAMCEAQCARTSRCGTGVASGPDAGAHCVARCEAPWTPQATSNVRASVPRAVAQCQESLPCGKADDACISDAIAASLAESVDAAIHAPDVQDCLAKQRECAASPAHFSDDLCGSLVMLVDSARAAATRCFDGTCDAVLPCMKPLSVP